MNIYVGNLPYEWAEEKLAETFSPYGTVQKAQIARDPDSGESRGFGFVEMPDPKEALQAIQNLDGFELGGRYLKVNEKVG